MHGGNWRTRLFPCSKAGDDKSEYLGKKKIKGYWIPVGIYPTCGGTGMTRIDGHGMTEGSKGRAKPAYLFQKN